MLIGTDIHKVLMFVWVLLLFRKLVATTLIGIYIPRALVIDGYLYSQVYIMDHTCNADVLCVLVWDVNISQQSCIGLLLTISNCCLIVLTHRVKDILDHFSSLSVQF